MKRVADRWYDVPVPPSSGSSLSGGGREAGRQAFQQGGGCLGFPQRFPGNVAQGNQGGAHGVMTGEGIQGGVGSMFTGCAGGKLVAKILVCVKPET